MNWAWYNLFIFLTWRWEDKSRQTQDLPKISSSMSGRWKEEPRRRNTEVTLPQHPGQSRRVCCSSTVNYWIEWIATRKRLGKYSKRKKLCLFMPAGHSIGSDPVPGRRAASGGREQSLLASCSSAPSARRFAQALPDSNQHHATLERKINPVQTQRCHNWTTTLPDNSTWGMATSNFLCASHGPCPKPGDSSPGLGMPNLPREPQMQQHSCSALPRLSSRAQDLTAEPPSSSCTAGVRNALLQLQEESVGRILLYTQAGSG